MLYLSLRHYEYVTAIARHGSLSAAALEVNVSQPALSAALSRIETHLNAQLFLRRKGAPLALTPRGRQFVQEAEALLAQAGRLEARAGQAPLSQRIELGCFTDLAPFLLAPVLKFTAQRFGGTELRYRTDSFEGLTAALLRGDIDMAISFDLGFDDGFDRVPLGMAAPYALVARDHPLAGRGSIRLADLDGQPLILFQEGLSVQHVLRLLRDHGLRPRVAHRAGSLEIMRSLAAHGEGVGISYTLPPGEVSYDGTPLRALRISDPDAAEPVVIARHGGSGADAGVAQLTRALAAEGHRLMPSG